MNRFLLGVLATIFIFLFISILYRISESYNHKDKLYTYVLNERLNTSSDEKIGLQVANEKVDAVNRRFDDLYKILGVIVTLILAINVGVFFRTEQEVKKYFKDNYDKHLTSVTQYEEKAGELCAKIEEYYLKLDKKINDESQTQQEEKQ